MSGLLGHDVPAELAAAAAPPGVVGAGARRRTPAEEARTLVASRTDATLASLTADGDPWASLVAYAQLADGTPVLTVSTLAEHGRNLARDPRASLLVAEPDGFDDPLDGGRVTLAGSVERPDGDLGAAARELFAASIPASRLYGAFGDFALYVLRVERVRWVGGYGRMDSSTAEDFHRAEPDPVAPIAVAAARHLNADHADALELIARHAGAGDVVSARCRRCDRYGLDLVVTTKGGEKQMRAGFAEPCVVAADLRPATVELTRRAREATATA